MMSQNNARQQLLLKRSEKRQNRGAECKFISGCDLRRRVPLDFYVLQEGILYGNSELNSTTYRCLRSSAAFASRVRRASVPPFASVSST